MASFGKEYKRLNDAQKQAVDNIDGPMLVVAGPGTGKTQLLSMRVANIIKQTDISPSNILCLTFTDNAARNMRERLEGIIGQAAYHINIHTFHSFGSDIISQYPDYFTKRQLIQQIDELGQYELLKNIFEDLPHGNPLSVKVGDDFVMLNDTLTVISWLKQNALLPAELHIIIEANRAYMSLLTYELSQAFAATPAPKYLPKYKKLLKTMQSKLSGQQYFGFPEYGAECAAELEIAINQTSKAQRYAPQITAWRNRWCEKNAVSEHVFKDAGKNIRKMHATANVYQKLLDDMSRQGLFDFDDMIIEAVHGLENNFELRANLQERYQYVLIDEFQDTSKAQLRMIQALGDNPANVGRPNIMAVGDDDQAIYAFQGAEVSNMIQFVKDYPKVKLISLSENYRSSGDILKASSVVASQITDRLQTIVPATRKKLSPKATYSTYKTEQIVLPSELAQYSWIAEQIGGYVKAGTQPEDIAVIAPQHRYLERLVPYLGQLKLPIAYERRENILDAPIIVQLLKMAELVVAISDNRQADVDALFSEVLGFDFWKIKPEDLLNISLLSYNKHKHWLAILSKHKNRQLKDIAGWFTALAKRSTTEPLEYVLDQFMGVSPVDPDGEYFEKSKQKKTFVSPMRNFYFSQSRYNRSTDEYLSLLGQLSTLRQKLRQWKPNRALYISDLVSFANLHRQANIKIIDTNPHTQTTNAVQVMTAYKAKGLEFEIVFVINAQDEVWGPTARHRSLRISLPKNLPIAPASDGDNDKLRLLFVAMTRAKHSLIITSYSHSLENRLSPGLSFIGGNLKDSSPIYPALKPQFINKPDSAKAAEILATDWSYRFKQIIADKPALFEPILSNYKLSVTHLNNFTDTTSDGPNFFFMHNLLRFPQVLTPSAAYGDAIHKSLQWLQLKLRQDGKLPPLQALQTYFEDMLSRKHLRQVDYKKLNQRGRVALKLYIQKRGKYFNAQDLSERGFNNEGVVIGEAHLSGKIDKMHFTSPGQVQVVDFKTGKPANSWQGRDEIEKVKLHKYKQQLLFYKLLVENSASYAKRLTVDSVGLEFVEVNDQNKLVDVLEYQISSQELNRFTVLINKVWQHILKLEMPDVSKYPKNLKGIQAFEADLIEEKI